MASTHTVPAGTIACALTGETAKSATQAATSAPGAETVRRCRERSASLAGVGGPTGPDERRDMVENGRRNAQRQAGTVDRWVT